MEPKELLENLKIFIKNYAPDTERAAKLEEKLKDTKYSFDIRDYKGYKIPMIFKCKDHGLFISTPTRVIKDNPCTECREYKSNPTHPESKARYEKFRTKLTVEEMPLSTPNGYLTVKCKKCRKRYIPTYREAKARQYALEGKKYSKGEHSMYCSDKCKKECSIYGKNPIIHGVYRIPKVHLKTRIRDIVIARDDSTCIKCGEKTLHIEVHHIIPRAIGKDSINDIDNLICLCKECHKKVHEQELCTYAELRRAAL